MKLLLYSHFFLPSIGGTEKIVASLAEGLSILRTDSGSREFEIILVTRTSARDVDDGTFPFSVVRGPSLLHLLRLVRSSDLIHVAGPAISPVILGLALQKPVVIEHHGFQTICPNGQLLIEPKGTPCPGHFMAGHHQRCLGCCSDGNSLLAWKLWVLTFVRRFLCSKAAANIVPTQWLGGLIQIPKARCIPHGLEPIARSSTNLSTPPVVIFQGRLVSTKGVRVLLEAANILRANKDRVFQIRIIGDGPERSELEQLVQRMGFSDQVQFLGRVDPDHLESAFANATVAVVPSLGGEVFGLVVAESMLRGLPIVASDLGAFQEVLGGAGMVFQVGNAHDLAEKLILLLDDSRLRDRTGIEARNRALECYSVHQMIELHARLYREVCGKTSN